ncbi:uncharacterized protein K452DRAFT_292715 [Aplosporella prunicola CBS 121167]|uniref:Heterokaryon incompatibility domain-containing protein n=1 Tax=Aplosporella prunicola CBS 121167 TaxID=1176127 RepID=A0A6A6AVJ9_9PEZI|nr:uncharacterized protein K452DRAFT_292715 [Aplosporella prunicola CBS 121167]KAF2136062.1 hypothetical protein K452DRAFT_292715 [Aplosporella prunicola CBS 121167]
MSWNRYTSDKVGGEIRKAIETRDKAAVQKLLDQGLDPNTTWDDNVSHRNGTGCVSGSKEPAGETFGGRPLHEACLLADTEIAELLIDFGADVNSTNSLGRTPLHQAADANNTEIATLLIRRGAKLDAQCHQSNMNNHGSLKMGLASPLHRAAARKNIEVARVLLQGGASTDVLNQDGHTALDVAVCYNSIDMIRELLIGSSFLEKTSKTLQAILYQAVLRGDEEMAKAVAGASTAECQKSPSAHGLESFADDLQPTYLSLVASLGKSAQKEHESLEKMESAEDVRKRLYRCLTEHLNCVRNGSQCVRLPTRVIDVGKEGDNPFLHESEEHEKAPYCALSYGWHKSSNAFITNLDNLESRKIGIPMSQLPKTLSEAILFTRRLGIQYIWINALCIIQDSPDDWAREASNMAQVYSGAILTLTAAHAQNDTVGLFSEPDETSNSCSARSCLDKRGWALQEQLLSARTIGFSSRYTSWNCLSGIPSPWNDNHLLLKSALRNNIFVTPSAISSYLPLDWRFRCWARMIEDYSRRSFINDGDRMLALSGICTKFQETVGEDVVTGIWAGSHLAQSLLWTTDQYEDRREPDEMRKSPRIPSWSWTSVQCPVFYHYPIFEDKFSKEIEVLSVTSETNNLTITLRTLVIEVRPGSKVKWKGTCNFDRPEPFTRENIGYQPARGWLKAYRKATCFSEQRHTLRLLAYPTEASVYSFDSDAVAKSDGQAGFWLVLVGKLAHGDPLDGYGYPAYPNGRPPSLQCLACRPVHPGSNEYRRIGVVEVWDTDLFTKRPASSLFMRRASRATIRLV